ncbi:MULTISPECIES: redoxin family protein [Rhizobium]|uniref:redoxin family protein n=1 Tax=Rhizobium TaxID=379 RepID=UPI001B31F7D5|nr:MULTISPECIES: redoxin family protein [Rhizobium]MBX4876640.1 redoxin family protein [Rhizobium bangladeshense]MBX4887479.1 redoxin family protein [Rhizobium bangladeshense]MBX4910950.1 redoxin family protein [Rhizobium bangladeshense]MBX5253821.1 redoxin family protein [Rhizobium sp. NLR4b]MBX5260066.1 redoxin family protein [Rhizobium sp. NLR16b]
MTSSLNSGSPAPSINVQHWLRGDPLSNFQLGKIYIPVFVSTTCSGCGPALARLAPLQEQYRDIGIEVIGIVANKRTATVDEALAEVDAWVTEWLPNANIRIGFDYSGEMDKHWMDASLTFHVPQAFVVDRDGSIVFIGPPHLLDEVLPKVIDGSWRASAEAKNAEKERVAAAEIDAPENALRRRIRAATDIEDWETALSAIEEGIILFPDNIRFHQKHVEILIGVMRDMEAGWIALVQFARTAIERNSDDWLLAAMQDLFGPIYDYSGLPLAERLPLGKDLSERIQILCPQLDALSRAESYETIAFYYHESGDKDRAVDLIEQALNLVDGASLPDVEKHEWMVHLLHTLAEYKGEQVCYGGICAAPRKQC